jgi:hypothetical protein
MRRLLRLLLALLVGGILPGAASLRAAPPETRRSVEECRRYLIEHPTGPEAEACFRAIVEDELRSQPDVPLPPPLKPALSVY